MYFFGSGVLQGFRNDVANSTPVNFGLVQDVQFDLSFTVKELYGQYQFPLAIGRGTGKFTGKAKVAALSGMAFNSFFFGQTLATGGTQTIFGEADTIPISGPYTVTVAQQATFSADYGVMYSLTGLPLTKVASMPATGQYSVTAGVYTFASADAGKAILISYTYTIAGTGQNIAVNNLLIGTTPTFQANFYGTFLGKPMTMTAFNCTSSKLATASKLEDFMIPEFDMMLFANAAGNVVQWNFGEAS